ncbi:putative pyruvate, phosphate dikinase regulatory protein [Oceanobacillus oncorhynchi subsp. incaldanensis]|uniref:Putative pyruvate, phosphate dikinase regulatory protein n=1 Tax=Oceanobacillus oncorhynchi TaxID=545501 RepID=A0A0A1MD76_9BACI|nr:pyruvate, water dikinase regulatory protein [Oceanobacillus oncorhynchi]GIO20411.1 putative pyruvate, phosphate dikinase regulatory protein [Oceanobacillus oncorhynchi subsp. incaldanensis]CEI83285.1 Putative pyruvate, phosphate dikinase regulatory protein [Oceanobacillus oncorhynchi]
MKNEIIIYSISDSLGETSQKLLTAVSAQYPDLNFNKSYRFPLVNREEELLGILQDALKDKAIVVSTLVNHRLAETARNFSQQTGLMYLDLMHPFFEMIQARTGSSPIEEPGTVHKLDTEYFNRIAAIEFAVKYDDGKNPQGFIDSDLVLLGVSRTSKTPLSMYLANKGYKVSNLPLIPEVPLPQILEDVDPHKLVGLVCHPDNLSRIRSNRLDSLGLNHSTSYTDLEKIYNELDYSQQVFKRFGIFTIDVTDKSIEETAYVIEEHFKEME